MDAVFINGTVGVGKTTLAAAIGDAECLPHAIVDLDEIRRFSPAPEGDRFNHELELQNLASVASNYRKAGAERLIVAGVIEKRSEVERYEKALGVGSLVVCRLTARADVLDARLRARHAQERAALEWHLTRAVELAAILEAVALDDIVLDTSDSTSAELAINVRRLIGWN